MSLNDKVNNISCVRIVSYIIINSLTLLRFASSCNLVVGRLYLWLQEGIMNNGKILTKAWYASISYIRRQVLAIISQQKQLQARE